MATIRIQSDGDPFPAKAGVNTLTNDGVTARAGFGGNNTITDQNHDFSFTYRGGLTLAQMPTADPHPTTLGAMGIAVNGVVIFNPSAGDGPLPGSIVSPPAGFQWNAVFNESAYGVDNAGGHPQMTGEYHYHHGVFINEPWDNSTFYTSSTYFNSGNYNGSRMRHADGHSKIVGYSFDGYPIYGPYGYANTDGTGGIKQMMSSYRELETEAPGRVYTYQQYPVGSFVNDYEYVNGLGDLDQYNGRWAVTPEYPNGTYAYYMTFVEGDLTESAYPYIFGPSTRNQREVGGQPIIENGPPYTFNLVMDAVNNAEYLVSGQLQNIMFMNNPNPTIRINELDTLNIRNDSNSMHPLYIKTAPTVGVGQLVQGVTGQGSVEGNTVSWIPPQGSAGTYYYQCGLHQGMGGIIEVTPPPPPGS